MAEDTRYILQILEVQTGESVDKGEVIAFAGIDKCRYNAVMAAGIGLATPRARKGNVDETSTRNVAPPKPGK